MSPRHPGQRLVHRKDRVAITLDAFAVAKRLAKRFAHRIAGILGGVMKIDMQVALGPHGQVHQAVPRELLEHMVEKPDARAHVIRARAVQVDFHLDFSLFGIARYACLAHDSLRSLNRASCITPPGKGPAGKRDSAAKAPVDNTP
jgi:hypothetical protein